MNTYFDGKVIKVVESFGEYAIYNKKTEEKIYANRTQEWVDEYIEYVLKMEREIEEIEEEMGNALPKYNIGNKVRYVDIGGVEQTGTICEIKYTQILPWNDESKPLYLVSDDGYLRSENEILELLEV